MKLNSLKDLDKLLSESERKHKNDAARAFDDTHDGKGKAIIVRLDTKGRKGKSVTVIEGLGHNPQTMRDIAKMLKEHCGAGGTVKEGIIEIQGDQRIRVKDKLRALNYRTQ